MNQITIVSLGPGPREYLTLGALSALENAKKLVLRTNRCDAAEYLLEKGISFESLDHLHEACEDFDELIAACVSHLLKMAEEGDLCYAVLDATADETVRELMEHAPVDIIPGMPLSAPFLSAAPQEKIEIQTASSLEITGKYTNTITVTDGKIAITASDCPGEDCVHSGAIHTTGRSIVCLPNEVEVRIVNASSDVDFVVG